MGAFQKRSMSYWTATIVGWRQTPFLVCEFVCWNMLWDLWAKYHLEDWSISMHGPIHAWPLDSTFCYCRLGLAAAACRSWIWMSPPPKALALEKESRCFYIVPTSFELLKVLIFFRGVLFRDLFDLSRAMLLEEVDSLESNLHFLLSFARAHCLSLASPSCSRLSTRQKGGLQSTGVNSGTTNSRSSQNAPWGDCGTLSPQPSDLVHGEF